MASTPDEHGELLEFCFAADIAKVILDEQQLAFHRAEEIATLLVYVSASTKRAVVVKEDGKLTKTDIINNPK